MPDSHLEEMPKLQLLIAVLWPSFLIAIVASGLFFSAFDPLHLIPFDSDIEINALGVYTIGFCLFWALMASASFGTLYFILSNCRLTIKPDQSNDT